MNSVRKKQKINDLKKMITEQLKDKNMFAMYMELEDVRLMLEEFGNLPFHTRIMFLVANIQVNFYRKYRDMCKDEKKSCYTCSHKIYNYSKIPSVPR